MGKKSFFKKFIDRNLWRRILSEHIFKVEAQATPALVKSMGDLSVTKKIEITRNDLNKSPMFGLLKISMGIPFCDMGHCRGFEWI